MIQHLLKTANETKTCVSLILPMAKRGPETRKNAIELKSALKEVRRTLEETGKSSDEIGALLAPAEKLVEDESFWQHQEAALALYLAPDVFSPFKLSDPQTRRVAVGDRFFLRSVLQTLSGQNEAYLLSLSQKNVQLFHYHRGMLEEVKVPDLPKDLESALLIDPEQSLQGHTVSRSAQGGPIQGAHGHGGAKDERLGHLRDFLTQVEKAVSGFLNQKVVPLFLATVEENEALYRKISDSDQLASNSVRGNFEHQSKEELLRAFEPVFAAYHEQTSGEFAAQIAEAVAQGEGTTDLSEAVPAAEEGRVRLCLVADDAELRPGTWDAASREVAIFSDSSRGAESDLLDWVAAETWEKGGKVRFAQRDMLPAGADFAVSYRYTY